jgi:serine/threonine-protein kinase
MPDDLRIQHLLDQLLRSGTSPEEVCGAVPELLPEVRARWAEVRLVRAELDALFPPAPESGEPPPAIAQDGSTLPQIPGYEVEALLGRGGMGVVFRARHLGLNRVVALKMALAGAYAGPVERERFQREAEAVAALHHPNVVQIHDIGESDGRPYFTMEYLEGGSLARQLAGTPQPARRAAALVATVAGAVQAAHQGGIVHRDLKPGNVLLTADSTPKVSDFGLARRLNGEAFLTLPGAGVGTPSYAAPEQVRGDPAAAGPAVDVYALGAILYEMLTGRPPFKGETPAATVQQVLAQDPIPPSRLNTKVPRDLETICLKCLRKQPQSRYATAAALADDLDRFLRGEAIAARPESSFERLVRVVRRSPVLALATLAVAVLVGGGLWLIAERMADEREAKVKLDTADREARKDLRNNMIAELKKAHWSEARTALERAKVRVDDHGSPEVRRLLHQGARDLDLAARLEKICLSQGPVSRLAPTRAAEEYEQTFREAGLGQVSDDPELVASRIRASNIRNTLIGALDNWSLVDRPHRAWVLTVARKADPDPDPSGWRDRARDPAVRADRSALLEVIRTAPVADQRAPLLLALAASLRLGSPERLSFLVRIQAEHPGDFWANFTLGEAMLQTAPGEASRFLLAAVAIRPDLALGYQKLGWSLFRAGFPEQAIPSYQKAVKLDPTDVRAQHTLAVILGILGRHDETLDHLRAAIAANPTESSLHRARATTLEAKARYADALSEYRRTVALDPHDKAAQDLLRGLLARRGQGDEARRAWQAALAAKPPGYEEWCDYTEFCLFVGQEDEYRRARQELLRQFGASTDPQVAGRTARACLVLPASEEELRQAVALAARAVAGDRAKYPWQHSDFLFAQGLAEYRQGRFDRAITVMRGEAANGLGPVSHLVLALALQQSERPAEGREALKAAVREHDWRKDELPDPANWVYHVLRREAEGMILPRLQAFLDGRYQPRDNDERLALLGVCQATNRALTLVRLYTEIFRADPPLAEDPAAGHRYDAARAAALVGFGLSKDSAGLGEAERKRWRAQAREWLRADLAAWSKLLDGGLKKTRDQVRVKVLSWRWDPYLAGLREPTELEKLSADEWKDWRALWQEVGLVLARVRGTE